MVGPPLCRAVGKFGDGSLDADALCFFGFLRGQILQNMVRTENPWILFYMILVFGGMSDGIQVGF